MARWFFSHRSPVHSNYLGVICLVIASGLFASGAVSIVRGLASQRQVAETKNRGDIPIPTPSAQPKPGYFLSFAMPTAISVPAIQLSSPLITVGKAADGSVDTPKAPDFDKAAWFRDSPAPGQYGASIIVGHVDSYANDNGASVFYNLSKLVPGDLVNIQRSDKTVAIFKVYATRQYPRDNLPTQQVYGSNSSSAELRLITCAGRFDTAAGEYTSNAVIFASLVSAKPTT